jgi:hypothetical protein
MPLLAQLPLDPQISSACDEGEWLADKVDLKMTVAKLTNTKVFEGVN